MLGCLLGFICLLVACSDGDKEQPGISASPGRSPTTTGTPAQPNSEEATATFRTFVEDVQGDKLQDAWRLYAASLQGTVQDYNSGRGCPYLDFVNEFPRMKHLFSRTAPFEVLESFSGLSGSTMAELRLRSAEGSQFLATLVRVQSWEPYRLATLNSGEVARIPGAPDPLPSPDDPTGSCGIWTGPR